MRTQRFWSRTMHERKYVSQPLLKRIASKLNLSDVFIYNSYLMNYVSWLKLSAELWHNRLSIKSLTRGVQNLTLPTFYLIKLLNTSKQLYPTNYTLSNIVRVRHYIDIINTTMASQITSLTVVYSTVYSDTDQRKHQSSSSLAFVWGVHRDRWIPRTKGQLRGKCFHLMTSSWLLYVLTVISHCLFIS